MLHSPTVDEPLECFTFHQSKLLGIVFADRYILTDLTYLCVSAVGRSAVVAEMKAILLSELSVLEELGTGRFGVSYKQVLYREYQLRVR